MSEISHRPEGENLDPAANLLGEKKIMAPTGEGQSTTTTPLMDQVLEGKEERMSKEEAAKDAEIVKDIHNEVMTSNNRGENRTESERYEEANRWKEVRELDGYRDGDMRTSKERSQAKKIVSLEVEVERLRTRIKELEGENEAT